MENGPISDHLQLHKTFFFLYSAVSFTWLQYLMMIVMKWWKAEFTRDNSKFTIIFHISFFSFHTFANELSALILAKITTLLFSKLDTIFILTSIRTFSTLVASHWYYDEIAKERPSRFANGRGTDYYLFNLLKSGCFPQSIGNSHATGA